MTYRIHRVATSDTVVFALSGDLNTDHAIQLQEFLANEASGGITLDLKDVTLVDRAAVRFLASPKRLLQEPEFERIGSSHREAALIEGAWPGRSARRYGSWVPSSTLESKIKALVIDKRRFKTT